MNDRNTNRRYFITSFSLTLLVMTIMVSYILATTLPTTTGKKSANITTPDMQVYFPSEEDKLTFLLLLSDKKDASPFLAAIISIDPLLGKIPIAVLPIDLSVKYKEKDITLGNLYNISGGMGVKTALGDYFGGKIDRYIALDKEALSAIIDFCGTIETDMPVELTIMDSVNINTGVQNIDGIGASEILYNAVSSLDYELYGQICGEILCKGMDNLIKVISSTNGEKLFNYIANNSNTDISYVDYTKKLSAIKYIAQKIDITGKFIKIAGLYNNNGEFMLKESYIKIIGAVIGGV